MTRTPGSRSVNRVRVRSIRTCPVRTSAVQPWKACVLLAETSVIRTRASWDSVISRRRRRAAHTAV